jgi:hypothetical protein
MGLGDGAGSMARYPASPHWMRALSVQPRL